MGANVDLKNLAAWVAEENFAPSRPPARGPLWLNPSKLRRASGPLSNYCRIPSNPGGRGGPYQNRQIRQIPSIKHGSAFDNAW